MAATKMIFLCFAALIVVSVRACSLAGSCSSCSSYVGIEVLGTNGAYSPATGKPLMPNALACYYGECVTSSSGMNYEVFNQVWNTSVTPSKYYTSAATTLADCCAACKSFSKCSFFHYFPVTTKPLHFTPPLPISTTRCYMIHINATLESNGLDFLGAPESDWHLASGSTPGQNQLWGSYAGTWVGGICNPYVAGEPHFVGGHGTHFDFNGRIDKPYCIATDEDFAVNAMLSGYFLNVSTITDPGIRTWMKQLGFVWNMDGKKHTIRMVARKSKQVERGNGYMALLEVDGLTTPIPTLGQSLSLPGKASLVFSRVSRNGPFDIEHFRLDVDGMASIDINMRVAQFALMTEDDAEAHFDIKLSYLNYGDKIHGVLGQTLRNTKERVRRALKYSHLNALLHQSIHADREEGAGFLDGTPDDYITSSLLQPDCKYSSFKL